MRFEAVATQEIALTCYGGDRIVIGPNMMTNGAAQGVPAPDTLAALWAAGFLDTAQPGGS